MRLLFFIGDADWTARARVFAAAAPGLVARGHEVTVACPPGPVIDRLDPKKVGIVRIDPHANAAVGSFDFRRVAQERSLDVVFVHTAREQLVVGSGMRFGGGGAVLRRLPMFKPLDDEPGAVTATVAPAGIIVATEAQATTLPRNRSPIPTAVVPLGVDASAADSIAAVDRRSLHLRSDATVMGCPYAPDGRIRLFNVLRTLALLAPRNPRLRAVVFGAGATADDLRMHAAALGVAPLLTFVDGNTVDQRAIMKACDFVWIAADHDAAAFGCLDAMALRLPVIAERAPVTEHFVADGITGTLLPEGDPTAVAAAVAAVIGRNETRITFGNAGRVRVQREFSELIMIDGFERAAASASRGEAVTK